MSPVSHLQYGWWFAHWGEFSRRDRAIIALAGAGPDLDAISWLVGGDTFYRYHHILFHNAGATVAAFVVTCAFLWRRPWAWLLAFSAFGMHIVEDFLTVGWDQYPWLPFSGTAINLTHHLPNWVVQGVFQAIAMIAILVVTIWIYVHYRRTPLEIISPALDRLVLNYAVLPWRNGCARCTARAHFHCDRCGRGFCSSHSSVDRRLAVRCAECASQTPALATGIA